MAAGLSHFLYLRTGTGACPYIQIVFELAIASCIPLVPFVPFVPFVAKIPLSPFTSRLSPLAFPLLPLASPLLPKGGGAD